MCTLCHKTPEPNEPGDVNGMVWARTMSFLLFAVVCLCSAVLFLVHNRCIASRVFPGQTPRKKSLSSGKLNESSRFRYDTQRQHQNARLETGRRLLSVLLWWLHGPGSECSGAGNRLALLTRAMAIIGWLTTSGLQMHCKLKFRFPVSPN